VRPTAVPLIVRRRRRVHPHRSGDETKRNERQTTDASDYIQSRESPVHAATGESPVHARRDSVNECRSSTQTRSTAILRKKNLK